MGLSLKIQLGALALAITAGGFGAVLDMNRASATATLPPKPSNAAVMVVDACPGNSQTGQLTQKQFEAMASMQGQLLPSLGAVQQYVKPELGPSQGTRLAGVDLANPSSVFGTIGMGGPWDRQLVFVEVTGSPSDLQRHADALTQLVPRPDRVVVCPTALSEGTRRSISDELRTTYSGKDPRFYWAPTLPSGKVGVQLRSDGEALAAKLTEKYGNAIEIWLGHFRWPDRNARSAPASRLCLNPQHSQATQPTLSNQTTQKTQSKNSTLATTLPKLDWKLPTAMSVRSGESFVVPYELRSPKFKVQKPHFRVVITDLGGSNVVASSARQTNYTMSIDYLQPKTWRKAQVPGGTDSCDPTVGWKLPPGSYLAFIVPATSSPSPVDWTSSPIRLTVVL